MNWSCTLCGSRSWPDPESSCPACQPREAEPEENFSHDDNDTQLTTD